MRRGFLRHFLGLSALGAAPAPAPAGGARMKVLIKSAWGSADPTQASFAFHHANAFAGAGHEVQIFLLGEAVSLMRTPVANAVVPVGWPPLAEALAKLLDHKIPVHV
jgi:predicted peroxiredoxin